MTYYNVIAEFYDDKTVKTCIKTKQTKNKPKNQFKRVYGMTAFKLWLSTEKMAITLLDMIKNGDVYIDDLISFYEDCLPLERKVA